jgi:predicted dehydrogenase
MINIGLVGFGYWGPNLARNFNHNGDMHLEAVCDFAENRRVHAGRLYPQVRLEQHPDKIIGSKRIDAVAIATPVSSHYELARQALLEGKHVWLEKPMVQTVQQAEDLIELADKQNKVLFVGHTFVYTGAVRKIKELVDKNEIGDLVYYDSARVNLGLFQQDVDVIWDLAPHDLSILDFIVPLKKLYVSATGLNYNGNGLNAKSMLTIFMENNVIAHINVSWLSPVKIRQTLIGGTSKMILYDDNHPDEKVKVYDKGIEIYETKEDFYRLNVQYRVGDMYVPKLENTEALAVATQHFVDCILKGQKPMTGGEAGLEVVKVLVATKESLKIKGAPVVID